jgi:hypothetical protein
LYLADEAVVYFGDDQEIKLSHVQDTGLTLKHTATADDKPVSLTLQTGETDIAANDVIGKLDFQAPDEAQGTDAILVAAGIEAVSEGDFSSSNNATKLSFKTAASEAAAEKMSLSSTGNLTVSGDLTISGDDLFMGTNTSGHILVADGTNYNPVAVSGDISLSNTGAAAIASGVIVNADINASAAIADSKLDTITTANKVGLAALDIDGGTDIGEAIVDADLFVIDNGAGGTNRKVAASRIKTYAGAAQAVASTDTPTFAGINLGDDNLNHFVQFASFSPTLTFGGGSSGLSYDQQLGHSCRIGNICYWGVAVTLSAKGTSTGDAVLGSFPFTIAAANVNNSAAALIGYHHTLNLDVGGGYYAAMLAPSGNTTNFNLTEIGDNVAPAALTDADFGNATRFRAHGWYQIA